MVASVRIFKDNKYTSISLEEYVDQYCQEAPKGWFEDIDEFVNTGMNITNDMEYEQYLQKMNLKWFDYESVKTLYTHLKSSKYNKMFDDDILRYIAHIYGLGYFDRIKYSIDINNPNLDDWLNTKNVFRPIKERNNQNEGYSIMDLVLLKNANNAIRHELIFSSKW